MISKTKFSEATESSVVFTSSNREISSFALAPSSLKALLAAGMGRGMNTILDNIEIH